MSRPRRFRGLALALVTVLAVVVSGPAIGAVAPATSERPVAVLSELWEWLWGLVSGEGRVPQAKGADPVVPTTGCNGPLVLCGPPELAAASQGADDDESGTDELGPDLDPSG